jgi:hypothetical protein
METSDSIPPSNNNGSGNLSDPEMHYKKDLEGLLAEKEKRRDSTLMPTN